LSENNIVKSRSYILKSNNFETPAIIRKLTSNKPKEPGHANDIQMNEIVEVEMVLDGLLPIIPFEFSKYFGNFILIDRQNFETVAAGNVIEADNDNENLFRQSYSITREMRADIKLQEPKVIWLTGLSGSGKSTIANELDKRLTIMGKHSFVLDGDNLRLGINKDLSFSESDRSENIRRISEIAKLMFDAGLIVIVATISPFLNDRLSARKIFPPGDFIEVYVDTPLEECIRRDSKGLYAKAQQGAIKNFTGTHQHYEPPKSPELSIKNLEPVSVTCESIIKELKLL
jgi:bifunctional enzyme CysN/CysC